MLASLIKELHGICQMGFCIFAIDKGIFSEILASCECKLFQTYLSGVYLNDKSHTHLQESCQDLNFNVRGIKKKVQMWSFMKTDSYFFFIKICKSQKN